MSKKIIALLLSLGMSFTLMSCADLMGSLGLNGGNSSTAQTSSSVKNSSSMGTSGNGTNNSSSTTSGVPQKEEVTITFKQTNKADVVKKLEKGGVLTDIPTPAAKTGYTVVWDRTDFTNIVENITVNAVATANTYTITYDAEGFEIDGTTTALTYDAACTALNMLLTKVDAIFLGWEYEDVTYTNTSIWNVANDVTLSAKWAAKDEVVISFIDTDGTTKTRTVYKGDSLMDIPTPSAKTGYTVDTEHWYVHEECTQVATSFENLQEGMTVYAKSTVKTYTITLDANGGELAQTTLTLTYGQTYKLPEPIKGEMFFDGWTYNGEKIAVEGAWCIDSEDGLVTLVAKWDEGLWTENY
jgi:hypothetical protein